MPNPFKLVADINRIVNLLQELETLDVDNDGIPDIQEFKTMGSSLLKHIGLAQGDVAEIMALEKKVVDYLAAKAKKEE